MHTEIPGPYKEIGKLKTQIRWLWIGVLTWYLSFVGVLIIWSYWLKKTTDAWPDFFWWVNAS